MRKNHVDQKTNKNIVEQVLAILNQFAMLKIYHVENFFSDLQGIIFDASKIIPIFLGYIVHYKYTIKIR